MLIFRLHFMPPALLISRCAFYVYLMLLSPLFCAMPPRRVAMPMRRYATLRADARRRYYDAAYAFQLRHLCATCLPLLLLKLDMAPPPMPLSGMRHATCYADALTAVAAAACYGGAAR